MLDGVVTLHTGAESQIVGQKLKKELLIDRFFSLGRLKDTCTSNKSVTKG